MNMNLKKIFGLLILVSSINSCDCPCKNQQQTTNARNEHSTRPLKNNNDELNNKLKDTPMTKKVITCKNAPAPIGPYSHGVLIGNTLYVSGHVGKDPVSG